MEFSRQEYWCGLPFPSPGDLPNPGIKPRSPALQVDALTSEPPGKPRKTTIWLSNFIPIYIYPKETKSEKDTGITLFIAALFTICRTWNQPGCPLTDEWIKMLYYIYTMEYYSAIKNAFESVLTRWMNLEPIIQSEASQKENSKYHILTHMYRI